MAFQTVIGALVLGIGSYIIARWLKIPAILFYLVCGVAAGPVGLHLIDAASLGKGLMILVEIGVAIVLFEGGLSLTTHGFRSESRPIRRVLLVTLPLTGLGATFLAHYILWVPWKYALFFGALIVVTGPTVIGSLLKSVNLTRRLEVILHWESIWGDVIGVLLSALALKLLEVSLGDSMGQLVQTFVLRLVSGVAFGAFSGLLLSKVIIPRVVRLRDPALPGLVVVAGALGTFYLSNTILDASGPLAVAIAGFFLSYLKAETLNEIRHFKEQLSSLFISTLFVLLSAYINPFELAPYWPRMLFVAFLLGALVRPASVLIALYKTPVSLAERLFVGLIGPRGIIAIATVAYGALVVGEARDEMVLLLNLTFAIIFFSGAVATVFCRPLAKVLKVLVQPSGSGILVAGVNLFSTALANFANRYVPVVVMDRNTPTCLLSQRLVSEEVCLDLLDSDVYEKASEEGFRRLLAITKNDALNELIARQASIHFEPDCIYRVLSSSHDEQIIRQTSFPARVAFSDTLYSPDIISSLANKDAALEVLPPDGINPGVVPLLEVVNGGKGIRILKPGDRPQGETLCYVPANLSKEGSG